MPGFCYSLALSAEEGLITPVTDAQSSSSAQGSQSAVISALYCAPRVLNLCDVTKRREMTSCRVTVFVQLIYQIRNDASKVRMLFLLFASFYQLACKSRLAAADLHIFSQLVRHPAVGKARHDTRLPSILVLSQHFAAFRTLHGTCRYRHGSTAPCLLSHNVALPSHIVTSWNCWSKSLEFWSTFQQYTIFIPKQYTHS